MAGVSKSRHPVAAVRRTIEMTQSEFSRALGVSRSHLGKVEAFLSSVSDELAEKIEIYTGAWIPRGKLIKTNVTRPLATGPDREASEGFRVFQRQLEGEMPVYRDQYRSDGDCSAAMQEILKKGSRPFLVEEGKGPVEYTRQHYEGWKGFRRTQLQQTVDEQAQYMEMWIRVLLNAAGRAGRLEPVYLTVARALRGIASDFDLHPHLAAVLKPYVALLKPDGNDELWNGDLPRDGRRRMKDNVFGGQAIALRDLTKNLRQPSQLGDRIIPESTMLTKWEPESPPFPLCSFVKARPIDMNDYRPGQTK